MCSPIERPVGTEQHLIARGVVRSTAASPLAVMSCPHQRSGQRSTQRSLSVTAAGRGRSSRAQRSELLAALTPEITGQAQTLNAQTGQHDRPCLTVFVDLLEAVGWNDHGSGDNSGSNSAARSALQVSTTTRSSGSPVKGPLTPAPRRSRVAEVREHRRRLVTRPRRTGAAAVAGVLDQHRADHLSADQQRLAGRAGLERPQSRMAVISGSPLPARRGGSAAPPGRWRLGVRRAGPESGSSSPSFSDGSSRLALLFRFRTTTAAVRDPLLEMALEQHVRLGLVLGDLQRLAEAGLRIDQGGFGAAS